MNFARNSIALSTLVFTGLISGSMPAYADDDDISTRHTESPQSEPANTEADAPVNNQASAKGFIEGSHLNLLFRSYTENLQSPGTKEKNAWAIGNQAVYESGYTRGLFGVGLDASLFSAFKLNGGQGAGSRVHLDHDGVSGANQAAWTYPGVWDVKARVSSTVVKFGQQLFDDPFLAPHDNRALPPTFRGLSVVSEEINNLIMKGGSVDGVLARGQTSVTGLRTEYSGTYFSRFTYAGGDYTPNQDLTISLYGSRAENVWDQYYFALSKSVGDASMIRWNGALTYYYTHDVGQSRGGPINNQAYSFLLSGTHNAHTVSLGFQQSPANSFSIM